MQRLTIDGMPREEGFSLMHDLAAANAVPYAVAANDPSRPMTFDIQHRQFARGVVTDVRIGNYRATRSDALVRHSEPRLILQMSPQAVTTEQLGHQVTSKRGSMVAMWSLDPLQTSVTSPARITAITLPLGDVALPHRMLRELMGRDLGAAPFAAAVSAYLAQLAQADLTVLESDAVAAPTTDLIRLLLNSAAGDEMSARRPLGDTIGARIMLYVSAHLNDPDLTAEGVASRFSISRRYLYVILNRMGISLGDWLRSERLTLAASMLRDPSQWHVPVSQIAQHVGFIDHSSFSRAFREHYGCTPTEWRAAYCSSISG
ncbi:helix-turn-helix transcriptional regulator [Microbacterium hominis]|uniref:Helix-turn-helix transcriptional regulator n=1 Tax=Microbacterium hominis TaxID=162426 RepID=A0A7D4TEP8_9MICO|nr:AraC family transcriptional regulator [Microbacterium hominis]QKJ18960.1 helix-turn-helix transcriptional regulator [Microbacterium hominis]